jgi:hypothetical protein
MQRIWGMERKRCYRMSGPALFRISFIAVVAVILLAVWIALVLEAGDDLAAPTHETAKSSDETGRSAAPDQEAA